MVFSSSIFLDAGSKAPVSGDALQRVSGCGRLINHLLIFLRSFSLGRTSGRFVLVLPVVVDMSYREK